MATEKVTKTSEPKTEVVQGKLTLEQYVQRNKVNPGLVASFSYEAKRAGDDLKPRTKAEWTKALQAQSKRKY